MLPDRVPDSCSSPQLNDTIPAAAARAQGNALRGNFSPKSRQLRNITGKGWMLTSRVAVLTLVSLRAANQKVKWKLRKIPASKQRSRSPFFIAAASLLLPQARGSRRRQVMRRR